MKKDICGDLCFILFFRRIEREYTIIWKELLKKKAAKLLWNKQQ